MATPKQMISNKVNAAKSTGPRTEAGKRASRTNAIRHGLTAANLLLENERPEDYEAFRDSLVKEYAPTTDAEVRRVDALVSLHWRVQRIPVFEAVLFQRPEPFRTGQSPQDLDSALAESWQRDNVRKELSGFILPNDIFGKLARYEAHLYRQIERLEKQLEQGRERLVEHGEISEGL